MKMGSYNSSQKLAADVLSGDQQRTLSAKLFLQDNRRDILSFKDKHVLISALIDAGYVYQATNILEHYISPDDFADLAKIEKPKIHSLLQQQADSRNRRLRLSTLLMDLAGVGVSDMPFLLGLLEHDFIKLNPVTMSEIAYLLPAGRRLPSSEKILDIIKSGFHESGGNLDDLPDFIDLLFNKVSDMPLEKAEKLKNFVPSSHSLLVDQRMEEYGARLEATLDNKEKFIEYFYCLEESKKILETIARTGDKTLAEQLQYLLGTRLYLGFPVDYFGSLELDGIGYRHGNKNRLPYDIVLDAMIRAKNIAVLIEANDSDSRQAALEIALDPYKFDDEIIDALAVLEKIATNVELAKLQKKGDAHEIISERNRLQLGDSKKSESFALECVLRVRKIDAAVQVRRSESTNDLKEKTSILNSKLNPGRAEDNSIVRAAEKRKH
jgi:hypothetical protein